MFPASVASLLCPVCRSGLGPGGGRRPDAGVPGRPQLRRRQAGVLQLPGRQGNGLRSRRRRHGGGPLRFPLGGPLPAARRRRGRAGRARTAARRTADTGAVATVLDAGTGTGHYLRALLDRTAAGEAPGRDAGCGHRTGHLKVCAPPRGEAEPRGREPGQRRLAAAAGRGRRRRRRHGGLRAAQRGRVRPGTPAGRPPGGGHAAARATLREVAGQTGMLGIEPAKDERLAASLEGHFSLLSGRDLDLDLALAPADVGQPGPDGPGRPPSGPRRPRRPGGRASAGDRRVRPVPDQRLRTTFLSLPAPAVRPGPPR